MPHETPIRLLKYSNWIVCLFFVLLGLRALLRLSVTVLTPGVFAQSQMPDMWGMVMASISALVVAACVFRWTNLGRKLGIALCAMYVVFNLFLVSRFNLQLEPLLVSTGAFLALVWFLLPKVKDEFHKLG